MKRFEKILTHLLTAGLVAGMALNFSACSKESTMGPEVKEKKVTENESQENTFAILAKKGGQGKGNASPVKNGGSKKPGTQEAPYPQYDSQIIRFHAPTNNYRGGNLDLPNGARLNIDGASLTPPSEIPWGEDVTITMLCEKDSVKNELIFTFGPAGCRFDQAARIFLNYADLGIDKALLYYIDENGNYILQSPDYIDYEQKRMTIYIDHFSRYALAAQ